MSETDMNEKCKISDTELLSFLISKQKDTVPGLKLLQPWASFILESGKTIDIRTYPNHYRGWIGLLASGWDTQFDLHQGLERGRFPKAHYPLFCLVGFAILKEIKIYTTIEDFVSDRHLHLNVPEQFSQPCYGWILSRIAGISPPLYYVHAKSKIRQHLLPLQGQMARCRIAVREILKRV